MKKFVVENMDRLSICFFCFNKTAVDELLFVCSTRNIRKSTEVFCVVFQNNFLNVTFITELCHLLMMVAVLTYANMCACVFICVQACMCVHKRVCARARWPGRQFQHK